MIHPLLFNQIREIVEFQFRIRFGNLKGIGFKSSTVGLCFKAKNTPSSIPFFWPRTFGYTVYKNSMLKRLINLISRRICLWTCMHLIYDLKPRASLFCARAYLCTPVCWKTSATEIWTFYKYFDQLQHYSGNRHCRAALWMVGITIVEEVISVALKVS